LVIVDGSRVEGGKVAGEVVVGDRQLAGVIEAAAVAVVGDVAGQGAGADCQRAGVIDSAAVAFPTFEEWTPPPRVVVGYGAASECQCAGVVDSAAEVQSDDLGDRIAGYDATAERQRAEVQDAAAVAVVGINYHRTVDSCAPTDCQAAQDHRGTGIHVEHPRVFAAADGELAGARTVYRQTRGDVQFAAGQRDGLAVQAGVEDD